AIARTQAHLHPPSSITMPSAGANDGLLLRLYWAAHGSIRGLMSLPAAPDKLDAWCFAALAILLATCGLVYLRDPAARATLLARRPWLLWGLGWFAASCAALVVTYPVWSPYRSLFGGIGMGVVFVVLVGSAHRSLLAALVALRF